MRRGADIVYMTRDGQYVFTGDLYNVAEPQQSDRSATPRAAAAADRCRCPNRRWWSSRRRSPKYTVTVFTDVDCAYCRALHSQIADYNRLGVRVRYMFFPRTGPNTESWHKAEQVWCSADRKAALTAAPNWASRCDAKVCAQHAGRAGIRAGQGRSVSRALPVSWRPTARWSAAICRPMRCSSSCKQLNPQRAALGQRPPAASALQQLALVGLAFPLLGIGRRRTFLGDDRPLLGQLGIDLLE